MTGGVEYCVVRMEHHVRRKGGITLVLLNVEADNGPTPRVQARECIIGILVVALGSETTAMTAEKLLTDVEAEDVVVHPPAAASRGHDVEGLRELHRVFASVDLEVTAHNDEAAIVSARRMHVHGLHRVNDLLERKALHHPTQKKHENESGGGRAHER